MARNPTSRRSTGPTPEAETDPIIAELIEDAVGPYRAVLTREAQADLEEILLGMLLTHPEVAPVVRRLRARRPPSKSGPRRRDGGDA